MNPQPTNYLSSDVEINGTLTFGQNFVFEGKLEGEIISTGRLTVGQKASINGDINASSVAILGKVTGNVTVQEKCELHSESQLIGDLKAPRLSIGEGATFIGRSEVVPPNGRPPAAAQPAAAAQPPQGAAVPRPPGR